jgi:hypothetical protein
MPTLDDSDKGPGIQAALEGLILGWPDVTSSRMFGSPAYRAKGVLFAMIGGKGLILTKLEPDQRLTAAERYGARAFVGRRKEVPGWTEFSVEDGEGIEPISSLVRDAYENALDNADQSSDGSLAPLR